MADFIPFTPKGQINIYRFIPLDNTYKNTLHFRNREQQLRYFRCDNNTEPHAPAPNDIVKLHFSGNTFIRNERQTIRIEGNATNYYDCNYMAYQNLDFGEMWFFAFILSVEYINDYCTEIQFEIDVMQSFMWNYELRECYVMREHSLTDKIGDSLTPEPVVNVPFKNARIVKTRKFEDYSVVLVTAFDMTELDSFSGGKYKPCFKKVCNMPFGGSIKTYPIDDYQTITDDLQRIADKGVLDGIITMFLYPSQFLTALEDLSPSTFVLNKPSDVNGYTPINNKLFTYPFTSLVVDCLNNQAVFKFEFFDSDTCQFTLNSVLGAVPQIRLVPNNYNAGDSPATLDTDYTSFLIMENFAIVLYSGNNSANWWGQHGWATQIGTIASALAVVTGIGLTVATAGTSAVAGAAMTAAETAVARWGVGAAVGGAAGIVNTLTNAYTNSNIPPTARSTGTAMSDFATKQRDFYFVTVQPTYEGAQIIDDIFTKFGYTVDRIKVPNIRNYDTCRPYYNYIQCADMSFHWELFKTEGKGTSVPIKYMNLIERIYQQGITFWKWTDESQPIPVGRYDTLKELNKPD